MKSNLPEPDLAPVADDELSLSGEELIDLMQAVLDKGSIFRFRAHGISMSPFIHDGDIISISPIHAIRLGVGDVVAYVQPVSNKLVIHRLVKKVGFKWIILGDNSPGAAFEQVSTTSLVGRVTRVERNVKKIWLGLGIERYLIAFLSRARLLTPLFTWMRQIGWIDKAHHK